MTRRVDKHMRGSPEMLKLLSGKAKRPHWKVKKRKRLLKKKRTLRNYGLEDDDL